MPERHPVLPPCPPYGAIRLLHFADVHFGVETYGRYDPATGLSTRLIDFRNALNAGIDSALQRGVEIALFAGDAYKARDPSQTHQREFAACLGRLTSAGVPVVLLTGNHDIPNSKGRANAIEIYDALASEMLIVIDRRGVEVVTTKTGRSLQIAAIPYLTRSTLLAKEEQARLSVAETTQAVQDKYEEAIADAAALCALHPELPTVLMGHFTVATTQIGTTQASYLANEPQMAKESLRRPEFDYVALGHIHRHQDLNPGAQPPIVYSGSIERIDFGERTEVKGIVIADVARGHTLYEHVPVACRPFLEIVADTTQGLDSSDAPIDPTDQILSEIAAHDISDAVVKMIYRVRPEDAPLVREPDIRQALQRAFMVVAQQREVVGANASAQVRSKLLKESLAPLDALSTYIDTKAALAKRKSELMVKAHQLWTEVIGDEAA